MDENRPDNLPGGDIPRALTTEGALSARGLDFDSNAEYLSVEFADRALFDTFLRQSGYDPSSALAQYVFLLIAERRSAEFLGKFVDNVSRASSTKDVSGAKAKIAGWQSVLRGARGVRREIGEEIFGRESETYEAQLRQALFSRSKLKYDNERRERLYADVQTKFPLTSR
jgi:hypothetical protein